MINTTPRLVKRDYTCTPHDWKLIQLRASQESMTPSMYLTKLVEEDLRRQLTKTK